ncbi:MAG: hypothetical protein V7606_705 [Burkholderiales bacterium]
MLLPELLEPLGAPREVLAPTEPALSDLMVVSVEVEPLVPLVELLVPDAPAGADVPLLVDEPAPLVPLDESVEPDELELGDELEPGDELDELEPGDELELGDELDELEPGDELAPLDESDVPEELVPEDDPLVPADEPLVPLESVAPAELEPPDEPVPLVPLAPLDEAPASGIRLLDEAESLLPPDDMPDELLPVVPELPLLMPELLPAFDGSVAEVDAPEDDLSVAEPVAKAAPLIPNADEIRTASVSFFIDCLQIHDVRKMFDVVRIANCYAVRIYRLNAPVYGI